MSLFAIADLHLSFGVKKPMDVFSGWTDYTQLIYENWTGKISDEDTVVIPGDFSWGISLDEAYKDFEFLNTLPGKKVLVRGNHDYWWSSLSKNREFINKNGFTDISFIQNGFVAYGDFALCGTRGWFLENSDKSSQKLAARETIRLDLSLKAAREAGFESKIVFLHFPPVYADQVFEPVIELMNNYGVKQCFYGHLHGPSHKDAVNKNLFGIEFRLVSADWLRFDPYRIL